MLFFLFRWRCFCEWHQHVVVHEGALLSWQCPLLAAALTAAPPPAASAGTAAALIESRRVGEPLRKIGVRRVKRKHANEPKPAPIHRYNNIAHMLCLPLPRALVLSHSVIQWKRVSGGRCPPVCPPSIPLNWVSTGASGQSSAIIQRECLHPCEAECLITATDSRWLSWVLISVCCYWVEIRLPAYQFHRVCMWSIYLSSIYLSIYLTESNKIEQTCRMKSGAIRGAENLIRLNWPLLTSVIKYWLFLLRSFVI